MMQGYEHEEYAAITLPEAASSLSWSRNSDRLLVGTERGSLLLYDPAKEEPVQAKEVHTGWVCRALFSPDMCFLASVGYDHTLIIQDEPTWGSMIRSSTVFGDLPEDVSWSPDSSKLAVAAGAVHLLEMGALRQMGIYNGHQRWHQEGKASRVCWAPDGKSIASGGDRMDAGHIRVWHPEHQTTLAQARLHAEGTGALSFAGAETLLSGGKGKTAALYRWGFLSDDLEKLDAGGDSIFSVSPASDSPLFVYSGIQEPVIYQDLSQPIPVTKSPLFPLETQGYYAAWSPDGKRIAATRGQLLQVWSVYPAQVSGRR